VLSTKDSKPLNSLNNLLQVFEDQIYQALEAKFGTKRHELLYDIVNEINDSLLRRLATVIWSPARDRGDDDQRVESKIEALQWL